jgi:hypothetical protein
MRDISDYMCCSYLRRLFRINVAIFTPCVAIALGLLASMSAHGGLALTGATLFDADASGNNLNGTGNAVAHGAWTTVLDQQTSAGDYGGELFLTQVPNPTDSDFLSPSAALSIPLSPGTNTIYFYCDGNDPLGGSQAFGLNLFLDNAGPVSPGLSGYTPYPGTPGTLQADSSTNTAGYNFQFAAGAGALTYTRGGQAITLSDFEVTAVGGPGGDSTVELVSSTYSAPYTPPPSDPNGDTDTYGQFTVTVATAPPMLIDLQMEAQGIIQFTFTNISGATFSVLSATNISLPLTNWTVVGAASNVGSGGLLQFTSQPTTNDAQRFYTVRSP